MNNIFIIINKNKNIIFDVLNKDLRFIKNKFKLWTFYNELITYYNHLNLIYELFRIHINI
jgi:hypothetical protein